MHQNHGFHGSSVNITSALTKYVKSKRKFMSLCPRCEHKIDVFSLYLSAFPFYFKCANCQLRLKLISSKLFWAIFLLYSAVVFTLIMYIPIFSKYGLGVILAILGWFFVYYKSSPYILSKDNVALYGSD